MIFQLLLNHAALKSAKAELLHFQEMSKKLQTSVVATQKEIKASHKELEVERSTVSTLEELVKDVKGQLEVASQKITNTNEQLACRDGVITRLREEMSTVRKSKEEIDKKYQEKVIELDTEKIKLREVFTMYIKLYQERINIMKRKRERKRVRSAHAVN